MGAECQPLDHQESPTSVLFLALLGLCCCAGFSLVAVVGGCSSLQGMGFSLRWLLLLRGAGSGACGLSNWGKWAKLLLGMWDLPGPGTEPVSPASAGGFLTTEPPGTPSHQFLFKMSC